MSSRNNLIPENYDNSFKPTSFKSIYASYDHQCTKNYPESMNNAYSLIVPFMNTIPIPNYPNPYAVNINIEKSNITKSNSVFNHQSRYDLESSNYASFLSSPNQNKEGLGSLSNQNTQILESFSNKQSKSSPVNTFPMAWTCYQDCKKKKWICPLRGDKPC